MKKYAYPISLFLKIHQPNKMALVFFLFLQFAIADTLFSQTREVTRNKVAPGFYLTRIEDPALPLRITGLEINISRPNVHLRTALANNALGNSFENTRSMARRYDRPDYSVVGAVNGDFFGIADGSNPYSFLSNMMVKDHEFVVGRTTTHHQFGVESSGRPFAELIAFSGEAHLPDGQTFTLDGVNGERATNHAIVYNHYFGEHTRTNEHGIELLLESISPLRTGEMLDFIVQKIESGKGSMEIPDQGHYVLSAHGLKRTLISETVEVGDTLRLILGTHTGPQDIAQLMGGGPRLVTNGSLFTGDFTRHPRTVVGISEDETRVFFVVIDGRQPASRGATLAESAIIIRDDFGAYNAVNLDGGGSSTLIVNDEWVHRPTDSDYMRTVGNALLAIAEPYDGEEFGHIVISPKEKEVQVEDNFNFDVIGMDLWGDEMDISMNDVTWEIIGLDAIFGRGGFFAKGVSEGYVVAHYQEAHTDTAFVSIIEDMSSDMDEKHPRELHLAANYPNPFNPSTTIAFELPGEKRVRLAVYDLLGREIAVLVEEIRPAGRYEVNWDAAQLSSGVYMYRLEAGEKTLTRRMTLAK